MGIVVTDVSFSIAKTTAVGSCGFCRIILNDCIAINRVRILKTDDGYHVLLPKLERVNGDISTSKPIVQLLNNEIIKLVTDSVLKEYHKLINEHNGFYKQRLSFK